MPKTLAPVRLMNADVAGGFQLLICGDAAKAFQLLPEMMEYLCDYRKNKLAMCRLAVDWVTATVPGGMNVEIRHGLHVRIAAPENIRAAALSKECNTLSDELCRWLMARDVNATIPQAADDGTVALLPAQDRMQFLSKERLMTLKSDSTSAFYYGSLENAGQMDMEAITSCLRKLGGGMALQLFELGDWEKPRQRMEAQLAMLVDSHAQAAVKTMVEAPVRYGFNLIVWGGDRRDFGAAAREICKLLQSDGIYLRCPSLSVRRTHQYYQAVYDVWALHSHVGGYIGLDSPADMRCMANVLTADELKAMCGQAADRQMAEEINLDQIIEKAIQLEIDRANSQLADLLKKLWENIDDSLSNEPGVPDYPVAPETPYVEASGEIKQYLAQVVEMLNNLPSREEFAKLLQDIQEIRARGYLLEEQNRRMEKRQSHTEQVLADVAADVQELKAAQTAMLEDLRAGNKSAQEALEILLERLGEKKAQLSFHPKQLAMMGYTTEEELTTDLKKRGLSEEEIQELRCVASLSWDGIHDQAEHFEVYGWALGGYYEKLAKRTFGELHKKEVIARKGTFEKMFSQQSAENPCGTDETKAWEKLLRKAPKERVDLSAFDGLSGKIWNGHDLIWGHLDYWRLNAYATNVTKGMGQELSDAQARTFWNVWFMIMTCMRRFRNSFVHSDEKENNNNKTVKLETLQAAHDLLFAMGTERKIKALEYFAGLTIDANYRFKFLTANEKDHQQLHEKLSGTLRAYTQNRDTLDDERLHGYTYDDYNTKGVPPKRITAGSDALIAEIANDREAKGGRYTDSLLTFLLKCKAAKWGEAAQ